MPAPSAGTAYAGKTGSLALISTDASGSLKYLPSVRINPRTSRGISIPRTVNNVSFPANIVRGKAMSRLTVDSFLYLGIVDADTIARAVLNQPNTSATGYWSTTLRPNNLGSSPENYFRAKFDTLAIAASSFGDETASMSIEMVSIDPESTSTALAAPSSGPLSAGAPIASFSDMAFTGASDVVAFSCALNASLDTEGGSAAGTNVAKYPKVPKGLIQLDLTGTVTLTQVANPATVLCGSSIPDTLTVQVGAAAPGFTLVLKVAPIGENKPVTVGTRYWQYTYQLYGGDGLIPVTVADLV